MSKQKLVEQINVKEPCPESWDEMIGNDEVRFCGHCNLNVNNLSAMTRRKALKIVKRAEGRICVRYMENPVDKTPVFADKLYQITRRAGLAAGVLGASLTLSTITYAQGGIRTTDNNPDKSAEISCDDSKKDKTKSPTAEISGTVTDSEGKFAAAVKVVLYDLKSNESFSVITDDEGLYEIKNVKQGNYKLVVNDEKGNVEVSFLEISETRKIRQDLALTKPILIEETIESLPINNRVFVTSGMIAVRIEYDNPLSKAVWNEDAKAAKKLVIKGADVNVREKKHSNITPLFLAVGNGNMKIAEMLLNFGADVNAVDENGITPLMRIDEDANAEFVRLLLKHGAKINAIDNNGNTALIFASEYAGDEVLQVLIENGADVNARNKEGKTALMQAAYDDNLKTVKTLVLGGANVNLKNEDGETALDLTTDEDVQGFLKSYGAVSSEL